MVVFLTPGWRQVVRSSFNKTALGLEVGKSLRGEGDNRFKAHLARFSFHILDKFAADALVFVRGADIQKGQFTFLLLGADVQRYACDRVPVDLEDVIVRKLLLDRRAGP